MKPNRPRMSKRAAAVFTAAVLISFTAAAIVIQDSGITGLPQLALAAAADGILWGLFTLAMRNYRNRVAASFAAETAAIAAKSEALSTPTTGYHHAVTRDIFATDLTDSQLSRRQSIRLCGLVTNHCWHPCETRNQWWCCLCPAEHRGEPILRCSICAYTRKPRPEETPHGE